MKNMRIYQKMYMAIALVGSLSLFSSCSKDDDPVYKMTNQEFVTQAASSNAFEVAAGGLAESKGQNAEIKQYGQHMVTDHSAAGTELKNLASREGWTVTDDLLPKERANLDRLSAMDGAAFDKEFARVMVLSHQDAVALFESASGHLGVPDGDLQKFATSKLPTLKTHLNGAVALNAKFNP
jgi:putative membrane protein